MRADGCAASQGSAELRKCAHAHMRACMHVRRTRTAGREDVSVAALGARHSGAELANVRHRVSSERGQALRAKVAAVRVVCGGVAHDVGPAEE
jgi:hypothetical protein